MYFFALGYFVVYWFLVKCLPRSSCNFMLISWSCYKLSNGHMKFYFYAVLLHGSTWVCWVLNSFVVHICLHVLFYNFFIVCFSGWLYCIVEMCMIYLWQRLDSQAVADSHRAVGKKITASRKTTRRRQAIEPSQNSRLAANISFSPYWYLSYMHAKLLMAKPASLKGKLRWNFYCWSTLWC